MAICYINDSMKRNLPGLLPMLRHRVGYITETKLGFGISAVWFRLEGYEDNEPVILRFYDNQNKEFEFVRKLREYR